MITYRIFGNGRGVLLTREANVVRGEIKFEFQNAPDGATAIFSSLSSKYYRELAGGVCSIQAEYFDGIVEVVVALNGKKPFERWQCESLNCTRQPGGSVLITPDDANLPEEVVKLRGEVDELRETNKRLNEKIEALYRSFEEIKQGYNLT